MRKTSAAEVRWRVRFFPSDVVEYPKAELEHGHAYAQIYVQSPRYPNSSRRFEDSVALGKPVKVGFVVQLNPSTPIPISLIYLYPFSCDTGETIIGQQIRWVSPNAIYAVIRQGTHHFKAVPVINARLAIL
jgi:hypothetical protein